jgi:hypothetical protein
MGKGGVLMNDLKELLTEEKRKFWLFSAGLLVKLAGYTVLFLIDWRLAVGVVLIEQGGNMVVKGVV